MANWVESEMQRLQTRILALQTQKELLLKSALPKVDRIDSCKTGSSIRNGSLLSPFGASTDQFSVSNTLTEGGTTSFLFIGVLSVAANSGQSAIPAWRQTDLLLLPVATGINAHALTASDNVSMCYQVAFRHALDAACSTRLC